MMTVSFTFSMIAGWYEEYNRGGQLRACRAVCCDVGAWMADEQKVEIAGCGIPRTSYNTTKPKAVRNRIILREKRHSMGRATM